MYVPKIPVLRDSASLHLSPYAHNICTMRCTDHSRPLGYTYKRKNLELTTWVIVPYYQVMHAEKNVQIPSGACL